MLKSSTRCAEAEKAVNAGEKEASANESADVEMSEAPEKAGVGEEGMDVEKDVADE